MAKDYKIVMSSEKSLVVAASSASLMNFQSAKESIGDDFFESYESKNSALDEYKSKMKIKKAQSIKEKN